MPKLSTPFQYEESLDGLNIVRPLDLVDEVKGVVDIPVLDVNPVDKKGIAVGKLLRCDKGVLVKNDKGFTTYNYKSFSVATADPLDYIYFTTKVYGVLWRPMLSNNCTGFFWVQEDFATKIQSLSIAVATMTWINFTGHMMRFLGEFPNSGQIAGRFYGYYN